MAGVGWTMRRNLKVRPTRCPDWDHELAALRTTLSIVDSFMRSPTELLRRRRMAALWYSSPSAIRQSFRAVAIKRGSRARLERSASSGLPGASISQSRRKMRNIGNGRVERVKFPEIAERERRRVATFFAEAVSIDDGGCVFGWFRSRRNGFERGSKLLQHDGAAGMRADVAEAKAGFDGRPRPRLGG